MASQRESGQVIHNGLQARYRMTHKESERCSKHNNDVEIVVRKTEVWLCEHEKKGQKGKRYVGMRMLVILPLSYPGATL